MALYRSLALSTIIGKHQCFGDGGDDYDDDENDDDYADYYNNDRSFYVCPSCGADSAVMNRTKSVSESKSNKMPEFCIGDRHYSLLNSYTCNDGRVP